VFAPAALLGRFTVDQYVEVLPQIPDGKTAVARVTVMDRVVDAVSGLFGVRLELPTRDYRVPAGLKCKVKVLQLRGVFSHHPCCHSGMSGPRAP
jgi:hypothetical protein